MVQQSRKPCQSQRDPSFVGNKKWKIKSTDFGNEILSLFNYKGQRKSEYTFYWLFKELNILVCPYCGTSYLEFIDTPKPKLRFHIDHLYRKQWLLIYLYRFII